MCIGCHTVLHCRGRYLLVHKPEDKQNTNIYRKKVCKLYSSSHDPLIPQLVQPCFNIIAFCSGNILEETLTETNSYKNISWVQNHMKMTEMLVVSLRKPLIGYRSFMIKEEDLNSSSQATCIHFNTGCYH